MPVTKKKKFRPEHFTDDYGFISDKLITDGMCNPGQVYMVSKGKGGMFGVFRLESQMLPRNGFRQPIIPVGRMKSETKSFQ